MTELQLYKFIKENCVEYHKFADDIILFVGYYLLEEFSTLLGSSILDEEGIKCTMKEKYICFDMKYICDYHGIDMKEVFGEQF